VRRNWLVAAAVVVIALIGATVLIVRLTDDEGGALSTAAWADSVCASLADWRSSITSLADVSGGTLTPESLRQKLADADTATDQLVTNLRDLGPPDLEAGADVEQALDDTANGLETSYQSLKTGAQDAADADTPAAFLQALAALAPDFQRLLNQSGETITALQSASLFGQSSAELERAFADAESCQALRTES
jgi:hypothetical protein